MVLQEILNQYPPTEDSLIEILLAYQAEKKDHFISNEEIAAIAQYVQTTESKVCSVLSFYTFFSNKPRGKYIIYVCKDVPCYVNEAGNIIRTLERLLGIKVGETTPNNMFTLEYASCLGACNQAPAMRIDGKTYTNLTTDKVKAIISEYRGKQNA